MYYTIISVLVAVGLKLLLEWPFWTILIIIGSGVGLSYLRKKGVAYTGIIAAVVAISIIGTMAFQFITGHLPLSSSLSRYAWLGLDVKIAAKTDPAVEARKTVLLLQTKKEDESVEKIKNLYKNNPSDATPAINELKKLIKEGEEVRAVIAPPPEKKDKPPETKKVYPPLNGLRIWCHHPKGGDFKIISGMRDRESLTIMATHGVKFHATSKDGINYNGEWHCGSINDHDGFNLSFSDPKNAIGMIHTDSGDFQLHVSP
jgi:hypothetical protein